MTARKKKKFAAALLALLMTAAGARLALAAALPDRFTVAPGEELRIVSLPLVRAVRPAGQTAAAALGAGSSCSVQLRLLGVLPLKTARVTAAPRRQVDVCGGGFGIKMFSRGVMLVGFSDIASGGGYVNPAREAGLRLGDYLLSVNGERVATNEQLAALINASGGAPVTIAYTRGASAGRTVLRPVADDAAGGLRAGMWVRDSSAGIGTLTFVERGSGVFAGLGHSITDVDTGESVALGSGEIVPVRITGAAAGTPGLPGELRGSFAGSRVLGTIRRNGPTGVYGFLLPGWQQALTGTRRLEVARQQEIASGPATVLATMDDGGVRAYDVVIEKLSFTAADPNRNMLIRVTDKRLLAAAGGIVQGMSGSPILQNGRLVGAVTHVLVRDPARGFAIFAETMLRTADEVAAACAGAA